MQPKESVLTEISAALLNQIRSVDRKRLIKRIGEADAETMRRVASSADRLAHLGDDGVGEFLRTCRAAYVAG